MKINLIEGLRRINLVLSIGFACGAILTYGEINNLNRRADDYARFVPLTSTGTMTHFKTLKCETVPWDEYIGKNDDLVPDMEPARHGGCYINFTHPALLRNSDGIRKVRLDAQTKLRILS